MDMLRLYARTLKVVEPIAEANQHKAGRAVSLSSEQHSRPHSICEMCCSIFICLPVFEHVQLTQTTVLHSCSAG